MTTRERRTRSNPVAETVHIYSHLGSRLFDAYYDAARGMWDLWVSPRTPLMRLATVVNSGITGLMAAAHHSSDNTEEIILDVDIAPNGEHPRRRRERAGRPR